MRMFRLSHSLKSWTGFWSVFLIFITQFFVQTAVINKFRDPCSLLTQPIDPSLSLLRSHTFSMDSSVSRSILCLFMEAMNAPYLTWWRQRFGNQIYRIFRSFQPLEKERLLQQTVWDSSLEIIHNKSLNISF